MALGAEMARPFPTAGGDDDEASACAGGDDSARRQWRGLIATERDRPVDPVIWGDEKQMKRELVAWAKAVASMAAGKDASRRGAVAVHQTRGVPYRFQAHR